MCGLGSRTNDLHGPTKKKAVYGMISEEAALSFAGALFKSVWALELLFLLRRQAEREWRQDEMILDLRSSQVVVAEGLDNLLSAGLAVEIDAGRYRYQSGSPAMEEIIDKLQKIYAMKPAAVIREIVMSPNRKLQILSDAFKFKNE